MTGASENQFGPTGRLGPNSKTTPINPRAVSQVQAVLTVVVVGMNTLIGIEGTTIILFLTHASGAIRITVDSH